MRSAGRSRHGRPITPAPVCRGLRRLKPDLQAVLAGLAVGVAQSGAARAQDADALAKQLSNPIASLTSVPLQGNFDFGGGPTGTPDWGLRATLTLLFP